jgi:hypothetical protein
MDRRRLRSPHDVKRDRLVRVAAKAFHFEVAIARIERVTERGPPEPKPDISTSRRVYLTLKGFARSLTDQHGGFRIRQHLVCHTAD